MDLKKKKLLFSGGGLTCGQPANMWYWFDATTISASDASSVSSWAPVTGTVTGAGGIGNLTQATGGSQPVYYTGGLNNKPTVTFDGIDDVLDSSGRPLHAIGTGDYTLVMVAVVTTSANYKCMISNGAFTPGFYNHSLALNVYQAGDHTSSLVTVANVPFVAIVYRISGVQYFSINGVTDGTSVAYTGDFLTNVVTHLGSSTSAGEYFPGSISEFALYTRALSSLEITRLASGLRKKWGI